MKKYLIALALVGFATTSCYEKLNIAPPNRITDDQIQELLKSTAVMITDYSSVFMDMVYMKKPVLHYQFDEEKFRRGQYAEGYFSYRDGFGPVCTEQEELVDALRGFYGEDGFRMREPYLSRVERFFPCYDTDNCRRNNEAIRDLPCRRTRKDGKGESE